MNSPQRQNKTIVIPFASKKSYNAMMADRRRYRQHVWSSYQEHPDLFPPEMAQGFSFCGTYVSKKRKVSLYRIRLKSNGNTYQVRPSFLMPYLIGETRTVANALFFRQWGVPFWALTQEFGHDEMYWYRAYTSLGRHSLVGTTVKSADKLPPHILCDEKHTRWQQEKAYIATTTTKDCILGVALCQGADAASLQQGYSEFAREAKELQPRYQPKTATIDGWEATKQALQCLFPHLSCILCFLHAWLSIKKRCRISLASCVFSTLGCRSKSAAAGNGGCCTRSVRKCGRFIARKPEGSLPRESVVWASGPSVLYPKAA